MLNWWRRLTGRKVEGPDEDDRVSEADVQAYAEDVVHAGFTGLDDAIEQVRDYFEDSPGVPDPATIDRLVRNVWYEREREQRSWPDQGDYGRLAAAFADLESQGFTARMNFTCCQTCGHAEIEDERTEGRDSYVFFHQQDSDRVCDPDAELYLAYSYFGAHAGTEHDRLETAVGEKIVETLTRHGLEVTWEGTNESRPAVTIGQWRKPLPA